MWKQQKKVYNDFIKILEKSLKQWANLGSLDGHILDILDEVINLLIRIDKNLFLNVQESKLKELITFIAINSKKSLSEKIKKNIMRLKKEIIEEQNKI